MRLQETPRPRHHDLTRRVRPCAPDHLCLGAIGSRKRRHRQVQARGDRQPDDSDTEAGVPKYLYTKFDPVIPTLCWRFSNTDVDAILRTVANSAVKQALRLQRRGSKLTYCGIDSAFVSREIFGITTTVIDA
jgi:hypothetical protein